MADQPRLSIIIPAKNERESLAHVLESLPEGLAYETIVIDGHSTDGTPELVRELGYRVVPQDGVGFGDAITTGINVAQSELAVIMNADGSFDPEALPRLLRCI